VIATFYIAYHSCSLFGEQFVEAVESVEDKYSGFWVVAVEKSECLAIQLMVCKAFKQAGPLSLLSRRSPCGDTEDEVVNEAENSLWDVTSASGLRA
jgi:hypothetical protein